MVEQSNSARMILAGLLHARTGQQLSAARSWRIETALKPVLQETGLESLDALVARITIGGDADLATRAVEALLNNESSFFRNSSMFDVLEHEVFERLRQSRPNRVLRIWSAGCSTGQEAYSLAMLIHENSMRWAKWTIEIVGTDISFAAIARARAGRFSQFEIQRGLPVRTMLRWFVQRGESWLIDPVLRRSTRFTTHNLLDNAPGRFDVILCRNVLMYFPAEVRGRVLGRLGDALAPDGVLVLGAGETVIGLTDRFAPHTDFRGTYSLETADTGSKRAARSR